MEEQNRTYASSLVEIADKVNKETADRICDKLLSVTKEMLANAANKGRYSISIFCETQCNSFIEMFTSSNYHDYLIKSYMDKLRELGLKVEFYKDNLDNDTHFEISFNDGRTVK